MQARCINHALSANMTNIKKQHMHAARTFWAIRSQQRREAARSSLKKNMWRLRAFLAGCFRATDTPSVYKGLLFCLALLASNAVQTAVLHQYFHRQFRLGMRLKVAVSALIYRKALRIQPGIGGTRWPGFTCNSRSTSGKTAGQYVNLMSVDAQRLQDLMAYVHILWSAPLQISIALFLLFRLLGFAAFGGLAVMLLNGPLTG